MRFCIIINNFNQSFNRNIKIYFYVNNFCLVMADTCSLIDTCNIEIIEMIFHTPSHATSVFIYALGVKSALGTS